jgi:hypothetical protein
MKLLCEGDAVNCCSGCSACEFQYGGANIAHTSRDADFCALEYAWSMRQELARVPKVFQKSSKREVSDEEGMMMTRRV